MEHLDSFVVNVDKAEIVQALLDEVAGVVVDVAAAVAADRRQEHLERVAVEDVLGRMNLETEIDPVLVISVEYGLPTAGLLGETFLDQAKGALRVRIEIRPRQRAGETHMLGQAQTAADDGRLRHLIRRPRAPLLRVAAQILRTLPVEHRVIGGMDRNHLPLKMGREFADGDADIGKLALYLIAIAGALMGEIEIEEPRVPGRNLDRLVAVILRPPGNALEAVVRWRVARELRQKQAWPLDGPHDVFSRLSFLSPWARARPGNFLLSSR